MQYLPIASDFKLIHVLYFDLEDISGSSPNKYLTPLLAKCQCLYLEPYLEGLLMPTRLLFSLQLGIYRRLVFQVDFASAFECISFCFLISISSDVSPGDMAILAANHYEVILYLY